MSNLNDYINITLKSHLKFPESYYISQHPVGNVLYISILSSESYSILINFLKKNKKNYDSFLLTIKALIRNKIIFYYDLNIELPGNEIKISFKIFNFLKVIPNELKVVIQMYIPITDLDNYCLLIGECNDKVYWEYFYSSLVKDWKIIVDNKPSDETYIQQYKYLLNSSDIIYESRKGRHLAFLLWINESIKGRLDAVVYLVENGVNVNYQGDFGETALMMASNKGNLKIVKYLVNSGAKINYKTIIGETALMTASNNENLEIIEYLVEKGADVNIQNDEKRTALFIASYNGYLTIVKYLIDNGANINHQDIYGITVIFEASKRENLDLVKILAENGANVNLPNKGGDTVLSLAYLNKNSEMIDYLLKKGAKVRSSRQ